MEEKIDFEKLREEMVEYQMKRRGIKNEKVLSAFLKVPREKFVPADLQNCAYDDCPLPIGYGQTISQPYMVAIMTELAEPEKGDKVLEIGTGSGYQTAILCQLCCDV
ncbi:MAG: protein-L-isoaspartate O-methyltransferase, partial [Candidatus Omnitrophica bacterium]|nr:protein-L-isoaspartate O-methyltransferase [Candidatus Omnitrophota bacterium]